MSLESESGEHLLLWRDLSPDVRAGLSGKITGLYGQTTETDAFDNLHVDKQRALLLLQYRLEQLALWSHVRRVENVYGLGGVGMNFAAWPGLLRSLRASRRFTTLWAAHHGATGGFRERGRSLAALHFLYAEKADARFWSVHFDHYNPLASVREALAHLWVETAHARTPDWRIIDKALRER